ncbi:MAG: error-prone DNA polymerase [Bdellovibrionaceae bacterium]|nr:error-prone DNA polymerase [Pseudobdellovibrionaceae bacterium]
MATSTDGAVAPLSPTASGAIAHREGTLAPVARPVRFIELMARSNFSFLQGASHPNEMVEQAIREDYEGIALCDLNGLYGVVRGHHTASEPSLFVASVSPKESFRYLVASELTLVDGTSIAFMPMTFEGYSNLCLLLTIGKRNVAKYFSEITLEQVEAHAAGLLAFPLPPFNVERFEHLRRIFGDRLYLPVWRDLTWESLEFGRQAFELERTHEAQLFVTQRPFMHTPERKRLFDVLTCIHHHTTIGEAEQTLIQNSERYLRPLADLAVLWRDRPDLLEESVEIAKRVDFKLTDIKYQYPHSKIPAGMTATTYMRHLVEEGARRRFPKGVTPEVRHQIDHELEIIRDLAYEDYFLTVYEICEFAREKGILYQGRGSAANSVACFCLGLTAVHPEKVGLLFERFISRERQEPPDIDIDFEHERREEVIQHIYRTYGSEHAAMVCTVIRFKSRLAIREVAKVLGIPLSTVNAMVKFMGRDGMRRLVADESLHEKFKIEKWRWLAMLQLTQEIKGFPRHLGIHTGGFLITQEPITRIVPVEKATMDGRYVIQWNKDDINDMKLMKIDVLGLGMLSALRRCLELLRTHKNFRGDLAELPSEDPATYDMICKADTVGVFQIESRAQMQTLPRLQPRNFYDLVIEIALVRPGPLQGGMVHPYLRRRKGLEKPTYAVKELEPVLRRTLGVPIFQEQVMQIAVAAAGFTPGESDELRRIMSRAWRQEGTMEGVRGRLFRGMAEKNIPQSMAEQIYQTIEGFANYGFPESHSASFALLAYASCYIKCHHPDVFTCALLNSQPMGFYPPRVLIREAQKSGVKFLPLDIQTSDVEYRLLSRPREAEGYRAPERPPRLDHLDDIRVGFIGLSAFPREWMEKIVSERHARGHYLSLEDFVRRLEMPRPLLAKLARAGAFQCWGLEPRRLLWQIESLSLDPQSFLWGQAKENPDDRETELPFESNWDRMAREYESSGYSLDTHPLGILRAGINARSEQLRARRLIPFSDSRDLERDRSGLKVRVAGMIGVTQRPPTAKGMCFITLEDEFGFMNIVIPPDVYQRDRHTVYSNGFLEVQGRLEKTGDGLVNLRAERVFLLRIETTTPELDHSSRHW